MKKTLKFLALTALVAACLSTTIFGFSDVTDEDLSLSISALQSMEIVGGYSDGTFKPDNYVTRAEFAKMVVEASSESVTLSTTGITSPFSDVTSSHWAAKYITLASDDLGYFSGNLDGTFAPESNITLGEASTIMLRMLGYTTADIGYTWPEDYTDAAKSMGLLENVSVTGDYDAMSRGDVAQIVYNTLTAENSNGTDYVETWASSFVSDVVLVDSDTSSITYLVDGEVKPAGFATDIPDELFGTCRGTVLFNSSGRICGFVPNNETRIIVEISDVTYSEVKATSGTKYAVPSSAYVVVGEEQYAYGTGYYLLDTYAYAVLCYGEDGIVDLALPYSGGSLEGYQIYGYYEAASPNPSQPDTITILGIELDVNEDIATKFSAFAFYEEIVVTMDADGDIIDVQEYNEADGLTMFGVIDGSTVTLSCGLVPVGDVTVSGSIQDGQLVQVVPSDIGEYCVYSAKISTTSTFYVNQGKLGGKALAENAVIYECVGESAVVKIALSDISLDTIPSSKILFHNVNSNGEVDVILFEDVTGICYEYGMIITAKDKSQVYDMVDGYGGTIKREVESNCFVIVNSNGTTKDVDYNTFADYFDWYDLDGYMGGVVFSSDGDLQAQMQLTSSGVIERTAFSGTDTLVANGMRFDIADDVQVLCYATESWLPLEDAMVLSTSFEAFYDKSPEEGGQIRVIVTYDD